MDDYFQRTALLSPYQAYAPQLQYQPYQSLSPRYRLDRRQARRGGRSTEGLGTLPHAGLIPVGLRERQQRAAAVSRPLNLRGGHLPVEATRRLSRTGSQAKRPRNADDREAFKKKPRKAQEAKKDPQKEAKQERENEVMMLHKLWKSGKKDVSLKDEAEGKKPAPQSAGKKPAPQSAEKKKRNRKRRNQNGNKGEAKDISSAKPTDKSAKDATSTGGDPKKASSKQQPKRKRESQEDDRVTAAQPESENGNRVSAVTENHEKSEIEKEKLRHLIDVQKAALKAVTEFLGNESGINDSFDEEMQAVESLDTNAETDKKPEVIAQAQEDTKGREEKAFDFFVSLFNENKELHKVYEECCNGGTFECLVCAATGYKLGKKFLDLVGLVQHARKILKTKRRPEHRGYGRAVCVLLGWDPSRDPVRARTVTIRHRDGIPPPAEELQDNEETGTEKMELMDGKLEAKDENKNDDNGFKANLAKEDEVILTTVIDEDGDNAKDDVATDEDVSDLEEAGGLRDNDNGKLTTAMHDPSLAAVSSG